MRLFDLPRNAILAARNLRGRMRRTGLECIVLPLRGAYPERTVWREPLPFPFSRLPLFPHEVSLEDMQAILRMLGDDRRVQNVVLRFDTLRADPAALFSLRRQFGDLRARGKRLIAWLPGGDTWDYYLASACDQIVLPPASRVLALGLRAEAMFLKDALALAGIETDFEAIAEYKTTPDTFRRSTMSEPHREMLNSLLDSYFDEIVNAIAQGRRLEPARVRELIDRMPLLPAEAVEAGLADAVLYEDELAAHLSQDRLESLSHANGLESPSHVPALCTWPEASRWLRQPIEWSTRQTIGVVSLEGIIVSGRSRRVPLPIPLPLPIVEAQAGAETLVQTLRQAAADPCIAAVILCVDSPGGAALASDLIGREVRCLRERKPVVALLGGQAASGGYYIAAQATRIIARPTTLTGSIGIWGGKVLLAGLYRKLGVHREAVQRGAMAGFYSEMVPFSEEERARLRCDMGEFYARFKTLVANGRGMSEEQVEEIARGRVWTGAQARAIGLIDELGDFETALAIAKELAGLKPERDYTVLPVYPPRRELPPSLSPTGGRSGNEELGVLFDALRDLARERVWALAPWTVRIRG